MMANSTFNWSTRRGRISLIVIALLLVVFSAIILWGLSGSDWMYGTYGQISQAQWDHIAGLRDRLAQLDLAPEALDALDDALLLPHPSTEEVLVNLEKAVYALDPFARNPAAHRIQAELRALMFEISPDHQPVYTPNPMLTPSPGPTPTPTADASVA